MEKTKEPLGAPFKNPRREVLAQALARDLTFHAAAGAAGYSTAGGNLRKVARSEEMNARVARIKDEARWGGSGELGVVIDELRRLASEAMKLGSAAGMVAAQRALSEAGRFKLMLAADLDDDDWTPRPQLTQEQWVALLPPAAGG